MAVPDRSPAHDLAPARAIIDIGSNTVRLVIYGGPPRAPVVLHNEKVTARLGRGVADTGKLSRKAAGTALAALARYRVLLDLKGVPSVEVVATAAVRDAADGSDFLDRVRALGFAPRLLSGEEEAIASALGVIGAFPEAAGIVADLGGGSLELIDVADGACSHGVSLPIGTLRLPPLRAGGDRGLAGAVVALLGKADWAAPKGATLYLVGGSFRSLARLALVRAEWPSDDPHGFELSAKAAAQVARTVIRMKPEALALVPGLASSRLACLPDAAALLLALVTQLAPARLVFSSWGLREGLLFSALDGGARAEDPLLAGIAAYAGRQGAASAAVTAAAAWTAPVARPASGPAGDERLRLAATMLSLALVTVEPNLRPDAALSWAMRKRWVGVTTRGRAMLAASLLANTGRLELPPAVAGFAPVEDLRTAQAWGLATRLCRRLSGTAPAALEGSALGIDGEMLHLTVRGSFAALVNDSTVRDLKALAAMLGLKAEVRKLA